MTLSDGNTSHLLARGEQRPAEDPWLDGLDVEKEVWCRLGQQTDRRGSDLDRSPCLVISDLSQDERFKTLPLVTRSPSLRFYASVPIITKLGIKIGDLSVIDTQIRQELSKQDRELLIRTASICMQQLETAREAQLRSRSNKMNEALASYIRARATVVHALKDPPYNRVSAEDVHS